MDSGRILVYESDHSVDCIAVALFCKCINLNIERRDVGLIRGQSASGVLERDCGIRIDSGLARVPMIVDSGHVVIGKCSILYYLARTYVPSESWCHPEVQDDINVMMEFGQTLDFNLQQIAFYESIMVSENTERGESPIVDMMKSKAETMLKSLDRILKHKEFLCGPHVTIADISVLSAILRLKLVKSFALEYFVSVMKWVHDLQRMFETELGEIILPFGYQKGKFMLSVPHPILDESPQASPVISVKSPGSKQDESEDEETIHLFRRSMLFSEFNRMYSQFEPLEEIDLFSNVVIGKSSDSSIFKFSARVILNSTEALTRLIDKIQQCDILQICGNIVYESDDSKVIKGKWKDDSILLQRVSQSSDQYFCMVSKSLPQSMGSLELTGWMVKSLENSVHSQQCEISLLLSNRHALSFQELEELLSAELFYGIVC